MEGHVPCDRLLGSVHITLHQQHDLRVHQLWQNVHSRRLVQMQRLGWPRDKSFGPGSRFGLGPLSLSLGIFLAPLLEAQAASVRLRLLHLQDPGPLRALPALPLQQRLPLRLPLVERDDGGCGQRFRLRPPPQLSLAAPRAQAVRLRQLGHLPRAELMHRLEKPLQSLLKVFPADGHGDPIADLLLPDSLAHLQLKESLLGEWIEVAS